MTRNSPRVPQIKSGDVITFTNKVNYKVEIIVDRVEEKSWYPVSGGRNSYGTLVNYSKAYDFKIN